jgi:hypothetical protein
MRRTLALSILTFALAAQAAFATDYELELGVRSFGPDHERWPQVSGSVLFGPKAWWIRPALGGAYAEDPLYDGSISEGRVGIDFELFQRGRSVTSAGLGFAHIDYGLGVNLGGADTTYIQLAWRWERPEAVDFGVVARYVGPGDIVLHSSYDDPFGSGFEFSESISTVSVSFLMRW